MTSSRSVCWVSVPRPGWSQVGHKPKGLITCLWFTHSLSLPFAGFSIASQYSPHCGGTQWEEALFCDLAIFLSLVLLLLIFISTPYPSLKTRTKQRKGSPCCYSVNKCLDGEVWMPVLCHFKAKMFTILSSSSCSCLLFSMHLQWGLFGSASG